MLETEGSISKIDSHHILQEASELSDRVIRRGLAIWAHKYVRKHMVIVDNCCLQFSNSRAVFESPFL